VSKHALEFEAGLARLGPPAWEERLEALGDEHGYFEPLGADHMVVFLDAGPKLLVTFETAVNIRKHEEDAAPLGFCFAQNEGWSTLSIIARDESWFRDPAIYGYMDRLVDDGFFEDFDKVVFHGNHAGGYAAAAYSVAAPGCTVLAYSPQATLDPRVAGFDGRYLEQRRSDFTSRYGYAPDMIDATDHTFIVFDPSQRFDAIHAALFTRSNVTKLRCPNMGGRLDMLFDAMGINDDLLRAAMDGTLDRLSFARMTRARRTQKGYLRALYKKAFQTGHPVMAANACAYGLRLGDDPFFEDRLRELAAEGAHPTTKIIRKAAE